MDALKFFKNLFKNNLELQENFSIIADNYIKKERSFRQKGKKFTFKYLGRCKSTPGHICREEPAFFTEIYVKHLRELIKMLMALGPEAYNEINMVTIIRLMAFLAPPEIANLLDVIGIDNLLLLLSYLEPNTIVSLSDKINLIDLVTMYLDGDVSEFEKIFEQLNVKEFLMVLKNFNALNFLQILPKLKRENLKKLCDLINPIHLEALLNANSIEALAKAYETMIAHSRSMLLLNPLKVGVIIHKGKPNINWYTLFNSFNTADAYKGGKTGKEWKTGKKGAPLVFKASVTDHGFKESALIKSSYSIIKPSPTIKPDDLPFTIITTTIYKTGQTKTIYKKYKTMKTTTSGEELSFIVGFISKFIMPTYFNLKPPPYRIKLKNGTMATIDYQKKKKKKIILIVELWLLLKDALSVYLGTKNK